MATEVERDIDERITPNMTDENVRDFVIDYTCRQCYKNEFDKPGSCEECIDGEVMEAHKDYLYNLAIKRRNFLKSTNQ